MTYEPTQECTGWPRAGMRRAGSGGRTGPKAATHRIYSSRPTSGKAVRGAAHVVLRRPGCRPGGCAGLCTEETLAAVYRVYRGPLLRQARTILGNPRSGGGGSAGDLRARLAGLLSFDPMARPCSSG
jgi:hypothetical protein